MTRRFAGLALILGCCWCVWLPMEAMQAPLSARGDEPVALRAESLLVLPPLQPAVRVLVKNLLSEPYRGDIELRGPATWRIAPERQSVSLGPLETKTVLFRVEKGTADKTNSYPLVMSARSDGVSVTRRQDVVCAAAPYHDPTVDGDPSDWDDAIPVTFGGDGAKTVVRTFWSRRCFFLLVSVQETRLIHYGQAVGAEGFDCVQLALAPRTAETGVSPAQAASRFEFLLASTAPGGAGVCFQLASPGMPLSEAVKSRRLEPLRYDQAAVAVGRIGDVTHYECSLPFRPMRRHIEPVEGREFRFSVLVHDPDGSGIRDWGEAAGLWPWQRNPLAWCRFEGARWGDQPPFDSVLPWGFYSSKY